MAEVLVRAVALLEADASQRARLGTAAELRRAIVREPAGANRTALLTRYSRAYASALRCSRLPRLDRTVGSRVPALIVL